MDFNLKHQIVDAWKKYVDDKTTARDFRAKRSENKLKNLVIEAFQRYTVMSQYWT